MGILEHVSGLEDMMSEMEKADKPQHKPKSKKPETDKGAKPDSRLEKIEDSIRSLEEAVEDVKKTASKAPSAETRPSSDTIEKMLVNIEALQETVRNIEKGGAKSSLQDILRRLDETDRRIDETYAAAGEKIRSMEKMQNGEKRGFFGLKPDSEKRIDEAVKKMGEISETILKRQDALERRIGERLGEASPRSDIESARKIAEKNFMEMKSRMDVLQKYVDGKTGSIDRMIEDAVRKFAKDQKGAMPDIDRCIDEKLKAMEDKASSLRNDTAKMVSEALRNIPKRDEIRKDIEERVGAIERKTEENANNKLGELNSGIERFWKDAENSKRQMGERMKDFAGKSELEKSLTEMKASEKRINENIDRLNNSVGGRLSEFSRKMEFVSKFDLDKINSLANAEKKIDENLKLFALNSDVEKVWKETEGLKRYVDEKTRMADGLANSLRVWESRNMQLMEKEHDINEKLSAFPELKMMEGRIRKLERVLVELQKHFVAAQIAEPIIME